MIKKDIILYSVISECLKHEIGWEFRLSNISNNFSDDVSESYAMRSLKKMAECGILSYAITDRKTNVFTLRHDFNTSQLLDFMGRYKEVVL